MHETSKPRIFLASANAKKIAEMQRILAEHVPDIEVLGIADVEGYVEPVEDRPTFEGNALLKARAGVAATGLPSVADDSGLCVDALNGMPGVLSARWSGGRQSDARNNELLLDQLDDVPDDRRGAYFTCAIAWVRPDGERARDRGADGRPHHPRAAGSGGFGYDVVFVAEEHAAEGLTSAELPPGEKDRISHRGRALRELAPYVAADLASG